MTSSAIMTKSNHMGKRFLRWVLVLGLVHCASVSFAFDDPFEPQQFLRTLDVASGGSVTVDVVLPVPSGHYLYADRILLNFNDSYGFAHELLELPTPRIKYDKFLEEEVPILERDVQVGARLSIPADMAAGSYTVQAELVYQGCSPTLCYRAMTHQLSWTVNVDGGAPEGAEYAVVPVVSSEPVSTTLPESMVNEQSSWFDSSTWASRLFTYGNHVAYVLTFVGGFATGFTPCVLPLLPVVLLIIGVNAGRTRRNFGLSLSLAAGLALTYALVGLAGAQLGRPMGFLFQSPWFLGLLVLFFVAMSASMFGVFNMQLPPALQLRLQKVGGTGMKGAFFAGMSTGLLATPCTGPVLAALVAHVGTIGDPWFGFSLLMTYGAGIGTLFVLVGTFYGALAARLPKGAILQRVKYILGIVMLIPAIYYGWVLGSAFIADETIDSLWYQNEAVALAEAAQTQKPVLIFFTAKTCPPCLVMKQTTFQDASVRTALETAIVPLQIDTTVMTPEKDAIVERYDVVGWPTLLFLASDGTVYDDLTLVGRVVDAEELLDQIERARSFAR